MWNWNATYPYVIATCLASYMASRMMPGSTIASMNDSRSALGYYSTFALLLLVGTRTRKR